jgi:hypothetical protein
MLTETLLIIPFYVIGRCSLVPISHWLQGNAQDLTCQTGFRYDCTESQLASYKHIHCQNCRFWVFFLSKLLEEFSKKVNNSK